MIQRIFLALLLAVSLLTAGAPIGNRNASRGGSRSASTARKGASGRKVYARTRTASGVHERHVGTKTTGKVVVMTPRGK